MDLAPNQLARTETITFLSEGKEIKNNKPRNRRNNILYKKHKTNERTNKKRQPRKTPKNTTRKTTTKRLQIKKTINLKTNKQ
jgi:hypothetical protein